MTKLYPPLTLTASPDLAVSGYTLPKPIRTTPFLIPEKYSPSQSKEIDEYHDALVEWAKSKLTVKVHEDSDTLFRHESGLLVLNLPGFYLDNLKYGIDISSLADRLEFIPLEKPGDDNGEYFIKLLPAEQPVNEESQDEYWNDIIGEIDKPVGLAVLSRLKSKFHITRK